MSTLLKYIDLTNGDDSTGDGSVLSPWKTIQKGYNSVTPTNLMPYVLYVTGQGTPDATTITAKPNVSLIAAQPISLAVDFTITGGDSVHKQDDVVFENIYFTNFTWSKNDDHAVNAHFYNCSAGYSFTLKQMGSGNIQINALNSTFINSELRAYLGYFTGCDFLGTCVFDDTGSTYAPITVYQFSGGYSSAQMNFNGACSVYFDGNIQDEVNGATLTVTTTATGSANLIMDSSGLTANVAGSPTLTYLSLAQYIKYTPIDSSKWANPQPKTVQEALDRIAIALVGTSTPIA